jgi:uncharacterized protein (DUF362 family)
VADNILRRRIFQLAAAAAMARKGAAGAQQQTAQAGQAPAARQPGMQPGQGMRRGGYGGGHTESFPEIATRPAVAVSRGDDRRKNAYNAMMAIDKELQPKLKTKKYALIKPNNVNTFNQLAATHADALRGIMDYLAERFKGPVVIAESSAGDTRVGFENFKYARLVDEYKKQQVKLIDLNEEGKFERIAILDQNLHMVPCRLAARLLDPEAFIINSAILKTHNTVIASLSVKNMVLGAPLHQGPKETPRWNEKRKFHVGLRQTHYNMMLTAAKLSPNWGATLIDGYEGMEGNGPNSGTPVPSRIAIASTDFIAADRVGVEVMGVKPEWMGYLIYCGHMGMGQYDLSKIELRGPALAEVKKQYRMHPDIEREIQWMGPMTELPFNLGWVRPMCDQRLA